MLHNSKLQPGQDPDVCLYDMDGARDRPPEHGEVIRGQHLADRILKGVQDEYEYVRNCSYNQRSGTFTRTTWLRSLPHVNSVTGRGVAMHA